MTKARRPLSAPRTTPSATVGLGDTVQRLRNEGREVLNLGSGDPDFATPDHIVEAAVGSLRRGRTHYAPSRGTPELLAAIANYRYQRTARQVDERREVVVTPSAKYALLIALLATLGIGEMVMILTPSWVSYSSMVTIAGGVPYGLALDPADGFRLCLEALEGAYRAGTRVLVVNSPNNPTGRVFNATELDAIAEFACRHDLLVLSDEIYEEIVYGQPAVSVIERDGMPERTIVVSGFSKAFAMTGWRLGYVIAPAPLTDRILAVHQHTASCTTTFVQDAGVAALTGPRDLLYTMVSTYSSRMDVMVPALSSIPGLGVARPEGAFYLLADVSGTTHPDSMAFSRWALEDVGVAVVPGSSFGESIDRHVRIALTLPADRLMEAVRLLHGLIVGGPAYEALPSGRKPDIGQDVQR